jgi:hypothetical protein
MNNAIPLKLQRFTVRKTVLAIIGGCAPAWLPQDVVAESGTVTQDSEYYQ